MELFEALITRKSVRSFTPSKIEDEKLTKILEAAMQAPSAGRQLPWEFVVMTDREKLDQIGNFHKWASMTKEAPLGIVVCGNPDKEKHKGTWIQDCSASMENLLLAAHGLGLGGVWLGIYPEEDRMKGLKELLNLPENILPLGIAVIGYPIGNPKTESRYDEKLIHYNTW
ncbi:MAG: nitroreductase family protein [Alphaproteobacteria bacterium]